MLSDNEKPPLVLPTPRAAIGATNFAGPLLLYFIRIGGKNQWQENQHEMRKGAGISVSGLMEDGKHDSLLQMI